MVKNLPANAGDARDAGSISGSERSSGVGNGKPLQYACLGDPMDKGAWQATVHEMTEQIRHTQNRKNEGGRKNKKRKKKGHKKQRCIGL